VIISCPIGIPPETCPQLVFEDSVPQVRPAGQVEGECVDATAGLVGDWVPPAAETPHVHADGPPAAPWVAYIGVAGDLGKAGPDASNNSTHITTPEVASRPRPPRMRGIFSHDRSPLAKIGSKTPPRGSLVGDYQALLRATIRKSHRTPHVAKLVMLKERMRGP
jgi:hypothetical protein